MDTREKDELQRLIATKASTSISAINAIMLGLVAGINAMADDLSGTEESESFQLTIDELNSLSVALIQAGVNCQLFEDEEG